MVSRASPAPSLPWSIEVSRNAWNPSPEQSEQFSEKPVFEKPFPRTNRRDDPKTTAGASVMKRGPSQTFVRDLDILYQVGTVGGLTDRELLGRFTTRESTAAQQAFEAIVHRHGPMVLGVCRRILRDEHTAEDAFQATFLVLALKADTIRERNSLGPWLHGVASRTSRRAMILSRRREEQRLSPEDLALWRSRGKRVRCRGAAIGDR